MARQTSSGTNNRHHTQEKKEPRAEPSFYFSFTMFVATIVCAAGVITTYILLGSKVSSHELSSVGVDIGDVRNWERPAVEVTSNSEGDRSSWGSWRPGVYFGMKSHNYPSFLSTGIMWTKPSSALIRHSALQDELTLFEWLRHDGKAYGKHRALDKKLGAEIVSSFVIPKQISSKYSWAQRFDLTSAGSLSVFFYFGSDCDGNMADKECLQSNPMILNDIIEVVGNAADGEQPLHSLKITGHSKISGNFEVQFNLYADTIGQHMTYWSPSKQGVHNIVQKIEEKCKRKNTRSNKKDSVFKNDTSTAFLNRWKYNSSSFAIQLSLSGTARLDVVLRERIEDVAKTTAVTSQDMVSSWIAERDRDFENKHSHTYPLPHNQKRQEEHFSEVSKKVVSAVLGGIGHFVGFPEVGNATDVSESSSEGVRNTTCAPFTLLSGTPSRTSFPRGFLWDEGFHLMVSSQWSLDLGVEIISSWLESMFTLSYELDKNGLMVSPKDCDVTSGGGASTCGELGWIPRELILGRDALSAVPREFVVQRVDIANPPTIMLVVERMLDRVTAQRKETRESCVNKDGNMDGSTSCEVDTESLTDLNYRIVHTFLNDHYDVLCKWMKWYFISQQGVGKAAMSFRWRGRSSSDGKLLANTLASGLDDYPRALFPDEDEKHVDLHCWMLKFALIMSKIDVFLGHGDEPAKKLFFSTLPFHPTTTGIETFRDLAGVLSLHLDVLHWSEAKKTYADVGLHSDDFRIIEEFVYRCLDPRSGKTADIGLPARVMFAKNQDLSSYCPSGYSKGYPLGGDNRGYMSRERIEVKPGSEQLQHVAHIGYVSLFPLLLTLVPTNSPKLNLILDIIENDLLTPFGLRSLATTNSFYGQSNAPGDNPYWRGYIWLNINYLAVVALKHYEVHAELEVVRVRCARLYTALRESLLENVLSEYTRTGFLWEQYDDRTGEGVRGHPFSGWTALIVNIISESY